MENKQEQNKTLNTRQWHLYEFLKSQNGVAVNLIDIANNLMYYHREYDYPKLNTFNNSTARRKITRDIQEINDSDIIQKVIISDVNGVRLATKDNHLELLEKEKIKILSMMKRYNKKVAKFKLDNQMKLTFGTQERDTIKAFAGEENA